jgi:hypothetical protein
MIRPLYGRLLGRSASADRWQMDETGWMVFLPMEDEQSSSRWWLWVVISEDAVVYLLRAGAEKSPGRGRVRHPPGGPLRRAGFLPGGNPIHPGAHRGGRSVPGGAVPAGLRRSGVAAAGRRGGHELPGGHAGDAPGRADRSPAAAAGQRPTCGACAAPTP